MSLKPVQSKAGQNMQALSEKAAQPSVFQLLEKSKAQIAAALPTHLSPQRMVRIATTEIRNNPELGTCDPVSFVGAIIQCSQLGLEPGNAMGHVYLIPFWNSKRGVKEVQVIPGYRGLIDLARRSGQIVSISARVVYSNDIFDYAYGLDERLEHIPARGDRGDITYVYAVAKLKDGGHQFEVMDMDQIGKVAKTTGPWKTHFDEMCRKTSIRRLFKYLPVSIEIAKALDMIDAEETGESQNNSAVFSDSGIQLDWTPPEPVTTPQAIAEAGTKDVAEQQRLDVLDRVEKKIATRMQGGQEASDIEQLIGRKLDGITELKIEQLMAIYECVK